MSNADDYKAFTTRFKLFLSKHPDLITTTLSNIFTMRLIGNKTHGDLAEIAISEFINQYMYDFRSEHVGKDLFRAKSKEEDIRVTNEVSKVTIPVSLKAYGDGPLQLSTDKGFQMFPRLEEEECPIVGDELRAVFDDAAFSQFASQLNVLPLIYDEKLQRCNILIFDFDRARSATKRIVREEAGRGRIHPVYRFYDAGGSYVCEVRYGGKRANALQRGLWSHTKNGLSFFDSLTGGWISYSHNMVLVRLFSQALVGSELGHKKALKELTADIERLKRESSLG